MPIVYLHLPTYLLLSNIAVRRWENYNFFRIVFYDLINLIKTRVFRALNSKGGGGRIPRTLSVKSGWLMLQVWDSVEIKPQITAYRKYRNNVLHPYYFADVIIFFFKVTVFPEIKNYIFNIPKWSFQLILTLQVPTPQNGQRSVFDHFVRLALEGLRLFIHLISLQQELYGSGNGLELTETRQLSVTSHSLETTSHYLVIKLIQFQSLIWVFPQTFKAVALVEKET